jgi:hypothetical protein
LYRFSSDKSNGRINQKFADCFNDWVNKWGLIELNPRNRKFTWSNNQVNNISAKFDRIFVSTDWEGAFPLARVSTLPKNTSDHNPLLVDFGVSCFSCKKKFRFEQWWMERRDFKEVVSKAWSEECRFSDPMDVW